MRIVSFDDLTPGELAAWDRLRAANPALDSPYFHPGFAAAVHASGRGIEVAVHGDGEVLALLPFQRDGAVARPAGWPAADFQAPIRAPGTGFPAVEFLRAARVRGLTFDHLLEQPDFDRWVRRRRPSPYLEVTGGLDGYLGRASRTAKENLSQARRRARRAERELGEVVLTADALDHALLDQVIELKRAQYAATGARDYFADSRRADMLHKLLAARDPEFAGVLSAVHAGPHLLAAHFGLRSGGVLHWWFPVYDPAHARRSPGWILLRELIAAAPRTGVTRIDLGRGEDEYKRRAMTGQIMVCEGEVTTSPVRQARNALVSTTRTIARTILGRGR
ncbi:Acetyltransferase involved in cellulose biosynthesis, CelD/BcsL family [Nonomuraea maritima]|uniref:Acetyltransferase involved in cellulose biosynthesis, CelD/BcsL family n=1 Tax=Nonomuraea maritima TaxID=683260 RepID=A0A1G9MYI4_9ACTN|nr:GNAT family N-acetyltransferase [Nonomuraea maritima]SDL79203.1 Acetyltransferase involved in cellulose biosynthesis, CelD/BcsL family [Nonomuraea maritima]